MSERNVSIPWYKYIKYSKYKRNKSDNKENGGLDRYL